MSQVKVFGLREQLNPIRKALSNVIHACVVEALAFPVDKRAHRFFGLDVADFYYPEGRSTAYTIIEITMMTGRTISTRKALIRLLFDRIEAELGIRQHDIEICIHEVPPENWGFRGMHGDEVILNYSVNV